MARTVGIGKQNYEKIVGNNNFYVDKMLFIKEWWENEDEVTLIRSLKEISCQFLLNNI